MAQTASFREAAAVAIDSLRSSKLRSFLTLLCIILATTTLIAVMSVIKGMNQYIAENVSSMGSDGFRVVRMAFIGNFSPKKFLEMQKRNPQLTPEEFDFLKTHATLVRELGMADARTVSVAYESQNLDDVQLIGTTANMAELTNTQLASGRFISDIEVTRRAPVAVIGWDVKGSVFGESQDGFIDIPIGSYFATYGSRTGVNYAAQALDQTYLEQAQDEIRM